MRISEHFYDSEFRCRCGGCEYRAPHQHLLDGLEMLRSIVGGRPVNITSGGRCPRHNRDVGGAPLSQHLTAILGIPTPPKAADVWVVNCTPRQVFNAALLVPQFAGGGMGYYPFGGFVHVDVRDGQARWAQVSRGGPMVAVPPGAYDEQA